MSQHTPSREPAVNHQSADIATLAQQFVLNLFNQKNDPRLVFHTWRQTADFVKAVNALAQANGFAEAEWEAAGLAAWFINTGWLFDYQNPAPKSLELADKFFTAHQFAPEKKAVVLAALKTVLAGQPPKSNEAQLLSDVVRSVQFGAQFFESSPLLRLERELLLNQRPDKEEWQQFQMQQLLNARFYTAHAKATCEPLVAAHLVALAERLDKQQQRKPKDAPTSPQPHRRFSHLDKKTGVGAQTFFRTNFRNHIELSAIADNKAHIMISVNAILISVVISVVSYRNMTETNPAVLMPVVIFVVTGLASLIFAVLAARPKVTSLVHAATPLEEAKRNIVFFGNFAALDVEKYEALLDEVLRDSELLYGNLARDLYHLGKVLDRKYRFLSVAYNIFMVGFVATVATFLAVLLS